VAHGLLTKPPAIDAKKSPEHLMIRTFSKFVVASLVLASAAAFAGTATKEAPKDKPVATNTAVKHGKKPAQQKTDGTAAKTQTSPK
jgi:hypothetical protein